MNKSDFIRYNGDGCPFEHDDYLKVKLFSGKSAEGFASKFKWRTLIDGMDQHDLLPGDIKYYCLLGRAFKHNIKNRIKYDGKGCPVDDDDTIVLFWLHGNDQPRSNYAKNLKWRIDGQPVLESDVEYYAFVKPPSKPDNLNDKIKYDGKGCPVDFDTIVEIWLTNEYSKTETGEAGEFSWGDGKQLGDIAFYRLIGNKIKYDGNGQPVSDDTTVRVWWIGGNSEVHIASNIFWPRTILNHLMDLEYYQILKRGKSEAKSNNSFVGSKPEKPIGEMPIMESKEDQFSIPINMKMTDKANINNWKYYHFRHAGWSDEQLIKEGFMVEKSDSETELELITKQFARLNPIRDTKEKIKKLADEFIQSLKDSRNITDHEKLNICLACGKKVNSGKGVEINGDLFHTDCTPEGDPDYSKVAENWINIVNARKHGKELIYTSTPGVRSHNIGDSDYGKHKIQPWDVWLEYNLNGWDCDIVKRVLRDKESQSRRMDYEKIIHNCQERIRQIDEESEKGEGGEHF